MTYGEPLPEEFLLLHDLLTPLLFKREELRSIPKTRSSMQKDHSRVTIASSHLYADAVKKYYVQFMSTVEPLTPPPTDPRPQVQRGVFPCPSPLNSVSTSSLLTPSGSRPKIRVSTIIDLEDLSEDHESSSSTHSENGESIVGFEDLSEDHQDVLFWAILWVANGSSYKMVLLFPKTNKGGQFSLSSLKQHFDQDAAHLETYDPLHKIWRQLPWDTTVGPLHFDGRVILFRYGGITELKGFDCVKNLANRLLGTKGKTHSS